jgi:hypothetical protein
MQTHIMKPLLLILTLTAAVARAQVPVFDGAVLAQSVQQFLVATQQLTLVQTLLDRWGDPTRAAVQTAPALLNSLGLTGVGQTGLELRTSATGSAGVAYDGDGLYRPPGEVITTSDGRQFERPLEPYKKFDAVTRARAALENVMHDTEERRQQLRGQIKTTVSQLQGAETVAEVQKLQGVLTAQNAELAAIDRERDAALGRILVQGLENQTDAARQEQARQDERLVEFRAASEKLGLRLIPDPKPVVIPDPRQRIP